MTTNDDEDALTRCADGRDAESETTRRPEGIIPPCAPERLRDVLASRQFYDLMQGYRTAPRERPDLVVDAFEAVKHFLLRRSGAADGRAP